MDWYCQCNIDEIYPIAGMRSFQAVAVGGGKKLDMCYESSFDLLSCISSFLYSSYITLILGLKCYYQWVGNVQVNLHLDLDD